MDTERSPKRRRLDHDAPLELDSDDLAELEPPSDNEDLESDQELQEPSAKPNRTRKQVLPSTKLSESREAIARTGVVYLSRIPPRLTPPKLRHLLSPYGSPLLRVFLAPESSADHTRRIKSGGSKKQLFTEGWVEFADKKVAKRVAEMLNAERMGAKKGDALYDDLWCIKYLPKFKWHHLTEQIGMLPVVCVCRVNG
jgi:ESF2/ABP1 family protein